MQSLCKLMKFGSPYSYVEFVFISQFSNWTRWIAFACPLFIKSNGCKFISSHNTLRSLGRILHHVMTCLGREIDFIEPPYFKCNLHVNYSAWVIHFSIRKHSSLFGEILNSCKIWVCQRCRCFANGSHVLHEDNYVSRNVHM